MVQPNDPYIQAMQQMVQSAVGPAYAKIQSLETELARSRAQASAYAESLVAFNTALKSITTSRAGANPSLQYVENIPGKRIPFDYIVDIPIGPNETGVQQGTITISQEGPFVAVARVCTFLSQAAFQYTDPDTQVVSTYNARSFGRYRPVHSAWDLMDGSLRTQAFQSTAFPGDGSPHMISPSNASSFRTMQGDFRIFTQDAGSNWPRQNFAVPSSLWVKQINDAYPLGALDVYERGTVITFQILPQHIQNPSFGNVSGFGTGGVWPFLGSQWDSIEGINDPEIVGVSADPVTRAASGILTIGFHGYRIIQPAGIGSY
jgi:hypothetical protein